MAELPGAEPRAGAMLDLTSPDYVIELTELEGRLHVLRGLLDVSVPVTRAQRDHTVRSRPRIGPGCAATRAFRLLVPAS